MTAKITRRQLLAGLGGGLVTLRFPSRSAFRLMRSPAAELSGLARLGESLKGRLILPGDRDYDSARRVASFNRLSDTHPEVIVRCAEAMDVVRAITFAHDNSLDVAIRSGGHDLLGASVCDGMVIDLSPMKGTNVDPQRRTARVEAGVRAGELNGATQAHGLAAALGCHPGVGVAGLTLGGGLGWFLGTYGAACDNLLAADVITADCKMMRASAAENADLFWALRGGGGNFGIVTALEFKLHPVDQVLAGMLVYRTDVRRFLGFFHDFMKAAPPELAVEINIYIAEEPTIVAFACWNGRATDGTRVLKPLRSFGPPIRDTVDIVSYSRLGDRLVGLGALLRVPPSQPNSGPGFNYWLGGSLQELSKLSVEQVAAACEGAPDGCSIGIGHYMHGEVCRVRPATNPLPRRAGQLTYFFNTGWHDPRVADAHVEWVNRSWAGMERFSSRGAYINYLSVDDDAAVSAAYGGSYHRLAAIKRKYDPTNFLHHNRNIKPG